MFETVKSTAKIVGAAQPSDKPGPDLTSRWENRIVTDAWASSQCGETVAFCIPPAALPHSADRDVAPAPANLRKRSE
jgi:hypothetical protein